MNERLLTARQVSEALGLKRGTIYVWVHEGQIPHYKLGKKSVRFRASEVERWLQDQAKGVGRG